MLVRASLRSALGRKSIPVSRVAPHWRNVSSTPGRRTVATADVHTVAAATDTATQAPVRNTSSGSSSGSSSGGGSHRTRYVGVALGTLTLAAAGSYLLRPSEPGPGVQNIATVPSRDLIRAYVVYSLCSFPTIIDAAPTLLHAFTHSPIPGLKSLTEFVVRHTFFDQFVAGENLPECVASMHQLYARGMGGVLNYSAESENGDGLASVHRAAEAHNLQECKNAIEALGQFEHEIVANGGVPGTSSFAIKLTGLIDPGILERASTTICRMRPAYSSSSDKLYASAPFPGVPQVSDSKIAAPVSDTVALASTGGEIISQGVLATDADVTDADMAALHTLWNELHSLSARARDLGVKLMIDAEYACTQPVIDAVTQFLSREFNRPQPGVPFNGPTIFGTYQSYLRRAPYLLDQALQDAEENGYALGFKIVRGAYVVSERKKWLKDGRPGSDPIWPNKGATDKCYDACVDKITSTLAKQISGSNPATALSVVFATHNPHSVDLVLKSLEEHGLAERIASKNTVESSSSLLRLHKELQSKVFVAQLYGMRDDLTDCVVDAFEPGAPIALKYIAYGKLDEVLPFLARRAIENKSVMTGEGGAAVEKKRVSDELWRRLTRG